MSEVTMAKILVTIAFLAPLHLACSFKHRHSNRRSSNAALKLARKSHAILRCLQAPKCSGGDQGKHQITKNESERKGGGGRGKAGKGKLVHK